MKFQVNDRVQRIDFVGQQGTVIETDKSRSLVKWDNGQTISFRNDRLTKI